MDKLEDFLSLIEQDIAWRKREVSRVILMHSDKNSELILKLSILLIYSHWEGSIKNICNQYLTYVSSKKLNLVDLTENYKAIVLKDGIEKTTKKRDPLSLENEIKFIKSLEKNSSETFKIPAQDGFLINTRKNLNYKVFCLLLNIAGLDEKDCLKTKKAYIDEKLLENRHKIAHGRKLEENEFNMDIDTIKEIKNFVFSIIDSLSTDIEIYAEKQFFLSENITEKEKYDKTSNTKLRLMIDNPPIWERNINNH